MSVTLKEVKIVRGKKVEILKKGRIASLCLAILTFSLAIPTFSSELSQL